MDASADLAATLLRDPASAVGEAHDIAAAACSVGDSATQSRAHVIRGRALLLLGEIALAEQALGDAVEAAGATGDPELEADALVALGAVQSAAGRFDEAFETLDRVCRIASPTLVQRANLQRAAVCRDAGRYDEAIALLRAAKVQLQQSGNELDLARVLANCGGILTHQGHIDEAIVDLTESVRLLRNAGHEFVALQVIHDLGCAEAYRGDLVEALRLLGEAERGMAALGHDATFPLLSRAEALLRAGLTSDALVAAADAARRLTAEGHAFASLALLTAAEASRLDGDRAGALRFATHAIDTLGSDEQGSGCDTGLDRAARLEVARCRHQLGQSTEATLAELEQIVDAADVAGDVRTQVEAAALLTEVASELGRPERSDQHLADADRLARRNGLAQLHTLVGVAATHRALALGDLPAARRALRRSLVDVSAMKAMYGGGESNPGLGTEGRATADAAMRLASVEVKPSGRLAWMERVRTLDATPARPADRPVNFAALRANAAELRYAERTGEPTEGLRRHQAQLEAEIRAQWLLDRSSGRSSHAAPRLDGLHRSVGRHTVVSIGFAGDRTIAVVVDRRGSRSVDLAAPATLTALVDRARSSLRGMSVASSRAIADSRRRVWIAAVAELDGAVLAPLGIRSDDVVLVVPPPLVAAPWAATDTLKRRRFTFAPSVTWWLQASADEAAVGGAAVVAAGPRLDQAHDEAVGVAACHPGATLLDGAQATVERTIEAFGTHDIAHVVAHGRFRHDNPLWSTIELADGPMSVYELQQVDRVPSTIVLATCESGATGDRAGGALQGLAASLLDLGASTVVASVGPLPDDETTRDTMIALHRALRAGAGPAESLTHQRVERDLAELDATTAALITIGVGT